MNISLAELYGTMGGFAKGIVWLLLLMSIYTLSIAGRKLLELRRAKTATLRFSPLFSAALAKNDFAEAQKVAEAKVNSRSHLAALFRRALPAAQKLSAGGKHMSSEEIESVHRLLELNGLEQVAFFRRGLGVLATVGSTAPFVGLLGTTMGVVNAFTGMAAGGGGGLEAISAGIAEALITTAFGLLVALPAVWLYNYFVNRIELVSMEIAYATKEFLDYLHTYARGMRAA